MPPVVYNHGFIGFRVPAGTHRVSLRYMPRSVVAGAAISAVSAAIALGLLLRGAAARPGPRGARSSRVRRRPFRPRRGAYGGKRGDAAFASASDYFVSGTSTFFRMPPTSDPPFLSA